MAPICVEYFASLILPTVVVSFVDLSLPHPNDVSKLAALQGEQFRESTRQGIGRLFCLVNLVSVVFDH